MTNNYKPITRREIVKYGIVYPVAYILLLGFVGWLFGAT